MTTRRRNSIASICSATLQCLLLLSGLSHPAKAGSSPLPHQFTPQTDESLTAEQIDRRQTIQTVPWNHWSQPYTQNKSICRQYQGNEICLSVSAARRLNWPI
jgi:hypothetical protein